MSAGKIRDLSRFVAAALAACGLVALLAGGARAMEFHLQSVGYGAECRAHCPRVIVAQGQISNSTPEEFIEFLRENAGDRDLRTVVLINSQGGYVVASMELGQIFRRIGAATVVSRQCLSACVYAFMGGVRRVAPRGTSLGIHRMFANTSDGGFESAPHRVYDDGSLAGALARYSARMGVSRDLIRYAERISSNSIHVVTPAQMTQWRLASRSF